MKKRVTKEELSHREILDDIIVLIGLVKEAIETGNTDTEKMVPVYDAYHLSKKVTFYGFEFIDGHLSRDIDLRYYQARESFPTPEKEWEDHTQRELEKFNEPLTEFIYALFRICTYTKEETYYSKIIKATILSIFFKVLPRFPTKLTLAAGVIKEDQMVCNYELVKGENYSWVYRIKSYDIRDMKQKEDFINKLRKNLDKIEVFTHYLQKYMKMQGIPKSLF